MYIYKTTNLINGKIYIGQHYGSRKNYMGSGVILKEEIKKYGRDKFKTEIIEYCIKEELDDREIFWIKKLNARDPEIGYNISIGGQGVDPETARNKLVGKKFSDEHKENISKNHADVSGENNPMYGRKHKEETIDKNKQKIKEWLENGGFTEEQKAKMRIRSKGRSNGNYNPIPVIQFNLDGEVVKEWPDLLSLSESGFNSKLISRVCRGQRKTAFGFKWLFKTVS